MRQASSLLALATLAAVAGALLTPACRRRAAPPPPPPRPPPPLLGTIAIEDQSPPSDERPDAAAIEAQLRRVLLASGLFAAATGRRHERAREGDQCGERGQRG